MTRPASCRISKVSQSEWFVIRASGFVNEAAVLYVDRVIQSPTLRCIIEPSLIWIYSDSFLYGHNAFFDHFVEFYDELYLIIVLVNSGVTTNSRSLEIQWNMEVTVFVSPFCFVLSIFLLCIKRMILSCRLCTILIF